MASASFGDKKRPVGRAFREDLLGTALTDVYKDVDEAFVTHEARTTAVEARATAIEAKGLFFLSYTHTNHTTETIAAAFTAPFALTVIDCTVLKTTAAGADNAANTVTVKNAAGDAITDDMSIRNVAVGKLVRADSCGINTGNVASGAAIPVVFTRSNAGDNNACIVRLTVIRQ